MPTLGEVNALRVEIKHLRQQCINPEPVVPVSQPRSHSLTDCKLVVAEICGIFDLDSDDNVALLTHLRKAA